MAPSRWLEIQEILADAIERPAEERDALLDVRCAGDAALREEVESLLLASDSGGVVDQLTRVLKPARAWVRKPVTEWSGRRVAQYLVQDAVGYGGMAVVYRARDERLGRQVALKFLSPFLSADRDAMSRFVAEARAAAALDHPNVCTIFEIGETAEGQLFIAMPLYDGETLQERLDRGRFTFDEALHVVQQLARGLEHAHESGIVHRDVKPSNIVILPDRTAKILDFGIARVHDAPIAEPALLGTISYMSPEQASRGPIDCRSDIWSLAVVTHQMLTGERPFQGGDSPAVLRAILHQDPRLTTTEYPDVPAKIDRVLRRALAKAPNQRHATMALFAAELSALATDKPIEHLWRSFDDSTRISTTERRRAAVLVTVVSDYLALVEHMSPSEAHRLIARVRDLAVDVMREYGGLVNQAIGEEIVSLFGVPAAHEDDDLRAVRAALELHARVRALEEPGRRPDVELRIQSGLHIGPVVARRLHEGPRRYDIVGEPAAVASRLAVLAPPDELWVSPQTQRLVGPYVYGSACSPVVLDSHHGPVTPFRLLGETGIATRLEASTRTGLTPYVGRLSELSTLKERVRLAATMSGSVLAVVGEPGAGKSRLLHELQHSLEGDASVRVLTARCRAYGDIVPYGVFVQILCAALDLQPPLASADAVVARIRALDPSLDPFVPLFLHLLSVASDVYVLPRHLRGEDLQAALLDALAALMAVMGRRGPLLVLIEDWHWADTGSRAALMRVAELVVSYPFVLIVTSREQRSGEEWPPHTVRLGLGRLDFAASVAILESVLRVRHVADPLARWLYDRAGGNPFFLEQMCTALLEQQAVVVLDGEARGEGALTLPDTIQGVIRARLDNLPAQALEVARVASVIGWEFDHALLAEVVPPDVDLRPAIAAVEAAGLIQQTTAGRTIAYRFTHALTQDVCYDSLVGHQRKALHEAIGRALASTHPERMDERDALLAHHFSRAEDWPSAIRFGRRAAERAIALSQFGDAMGALDQVIEWARHLPDRQHHVVADLLLQQERVCETLGLRARQQQLIDQLIDHLAHEEASARLAEVSLRQGDLSTLLRRFDAADRALGTALRFGEERGDTTLVRSALRSLGLLRWHEGRHAEALDITRRVLAADRECDDELAVAGDLANSGAILRAMGDYEGARSKLEEALAMPALRNDPKKLVYTQHNLANVYRALGDLDRALECLTHSDEIARYHLLPIQRSFHLTSIAHIELQQGRIETALETYRNAVDLSRRARHADGLVQALRMLGTALLGLARYDEALPCLQEAAQLFAQLEDRVSEAEMRSGVAQILERSSPDAAAEAWQAVLTLQRRRGDSRGELEAREGLARTKRSKGADEAIPAFESALALAATIGERPREATIHNVLGILEWERGSYASALRHYESALALVRGSGIRADEAVILNSLGACLTCLNRPDEARTILEESLTLSRESGERQLEAHALAALGHVALNGHDWNAAADWFERSRAARHEIGDRTGEGWMYLRLAEVHRRIGDDASAVADAGAAAAAAAESGDDALAAACVEAARTIHNQRSGEATDAALHHRTRRSASHV